MRRRRRALPGAERRLAARRLASQLRRHPWFMRARSIALYFANDGEIDPGPLLQSALRAGKQVYLPVLWHGNSLRFTHYRPDTPLQVNRFGIPEPDWRHSHWRAPWTLDLVLMPLVAFDTAGRRLGMGGGFYDRSFAFMQRSTPIRRPRLVGLAYAWQQVPELQADSWDVPLAGIATDQGVKSVGGS